MATAAAAAAAAMAAAPAPAPAPAPAASAATAKPRPGPPLTDMMKSCIVDYMNHCLAMHIIIPSTTVSNVNKGIIGEHEIYRIFRSVTDHEAKAGKVCAGRPFDPTHELHKNALVPNTPTHPLRLKLRWMEEHHPVDFKAGTWPPTATQEAAFAVWLADNTHLITDEEAPRPVQAVHDKQYALVRRMDGMERQLAAALAQAAETQQKDVAAMVKRFDGLESRMEQMNQDLNKRMDHVQQLQQQQPQQQQQQQPQPQPQPPSIDVDSKIEAVEDRLKDCIKSAMVEYAKYIETTFMDQEPLEPSTGEPATKRSKRLTQH